MTKSIQRLILCGQFFMILALEMTNPFLPLLIAAQGTVPIDSVVFYSTLGLILPMVANLLIAPLWGMAADRYGYKPMLMRASWALVVTQASMIFVSSVEGILVIRVVQGAFAGFIIAMQTYVVSISEWEAKGRQLSRLQSTKAIATAIAGFTGGVALTCTNYQGLYAVATLICFFITLIMQLYLPPSKKNAPQQKQQKSAHSGGATGVFIFLCILIMLTQVAKFLPDPGLSLFLNSYFPNNLIMIGLLYSLPALGMLCSSEWCGQLFDRCRPVPALVNRFLISFSVLGFLLMLTQAYVSNLYLFAFIRILWGVVLAALLPALFALCSDRNLLPGYALGLANSFAKLGNLIGLLLGGVLASTFPYPVIFLIISMVYGVFAIFVLAYHLISSRRLMRYSTV
jgi:MFS family permease